MGSAPIAQSPAGKPSSTAGQVVLRVKGEWRPSAQAGRSGSAMMAGMHSTTCIAPRERRVVSVENGRNMQDSKRTEFPLDSAMLQAKGEMPAEAGMSVRS